VAALLCDTFVVYDLSKVESIKTHTAESNILLKFCSGEEIAIGVSGYKHSYSVLNPKNVFMFIQSLCNREYETHITRSEFLTIFLEWAS